jgi:hypothetical protein
MAASLFDHSLDWNGPVLTTPDLWRVHRSVTSGVVTMPPRSYDRYGSCFSLQAPPDLFPKALALDIEARDTAVPSMLYSLSGCKGTDEFWAIWTRSEVAAKLLNIPILAWIRTHGLLSTIEKNSPHFSPDLKTRTLLTSSHVISFGYIV